MFFVALILYIILTVAMMVAVVCFESDSKKIIFWNLIVALTGIFGFIIYAIWFCDKPFIKNSIKEKFHQDKIYKDLIEYSSNNVKSNNQVMNFSKLHYSADIFKGNEISVIDNLDKFINTLIDDLEDASQNIIIQNEVLFNLINNESIISVLKEKQTMGVEIKCIYNKYKLKDKKFIKQLKNKGVRICKFNDKDKFNNYYKNNKNLICIDNRVAYLYSYANPKYNTASNSRLFYRISGEILKSINIDCRSDVSYALEKFYGMETKTFEPTGETEMQYITSVVDKDFEAIFLKAINDAKKEIYIHLNKFVPTPAIRQALQMAIMSGIKVRMMLPKPNCTSNYYSSRAYLKEMATYGSSSYLYDGVIESNFIIIDDLVIIGNFSLVNLEIRKNLQNMLLINDKQFAQDMITYFNEKVKDSYRIVNPKNSLLMEKIFKKFN